MTEELKVSDKRHWVNPEARAGEDNKEADLKRIPTHVAKLEEQMAANDAKLKEYIAAYKEKMAENDQYRTRLEKDIDRRIETRMAEFFRNLMPGLDHLDMALDSARKTKDVEKLIEGVGMIKSGLARIFAGYGLQEIDCLGKPFNPANAEAIQVVEVAEKEKDNVVMEVVQAGYTMNDLLIRPARVIVGRHNA
ncbi:MAG: nucleotide exchange factor GrpE [Nitrospinae bacterium]|nr:nucleotide exchange factor GrpE [Nitrospinota bacterium]